MVDLSFIATNYNKRAELPAALASLRGQVGLDGLHVEIIYADDASTDGSAEWLAAQDDVQVLRNTQNRGPSMRINQAAAAAQGTVLIAVDADDLLPANAAKSLLGTMSISQVPLVFGRSKRGAAPELIPEDASAEVFTDACGYVAQRKITRMGMCVTRAVWQQSGGADERVFIQDQSLPLRLALAAGRMAFLDAVTYYLPETGTENLSRNVAQQHHDRFLTMHHLLSRDMSGVARKSVGQQAVSALWKLDRDRGAIALTSRAFWRYMRNKTVGYVPGAARREALAIDLAQIPNIRRMGT